MEYRNLNICARFLQFPQTFVINAVGELGKGIRINVKRPRLSDFTRIFCVELLKM